MTPGELYTRLGVLPGATPTQIHRAYRKAAKTAHPDAGGTKEQWSAILEAYETLHDDRRRRIYDETGTIEPGAVDNHYAALLMRLAGAMDQVRDEAAQAGLPFARIDWLPALRRVLSTHIAQCRKGIPQMGDAAREWDVVAKSMKVPDGVVNVLRGLAEGKAAECRRRAGEAESQIREYEEALKLIEHATCAPGEMPVFPQLGLGGLRFGQFGQERMW